ncbi:MAG: cation:proton antiporter [Verrucomicrobiota bacterium]
MLILAAGSGAGIVTDLGWVFVVASAFGIIAHFIKIPAIIGFLTAGAVVIQMGPDGGLLKHPEQILELSELGVVFLMFFIGMEFDLHKLRRIFAPAFCGVALQTIAMLFLGTQAAALLGWSATEGLFLGAVFSISSSMVAIATIRDRDEMAFPRAQLAVGALIFEDILAIVLLVLLTGLAIEGQFELGAVGVTTFGVAVFVAVSFFFGRLIVLRLLKALEGVGRADYWVLFAVGLMLGESLIAAHFQFSLALGAFLAGSLLAGTPQVKHIVRLTDPFRILFGALFFVSVGMRIDPRLLIDSFLISLLLSILVVLGKVLTIWFGMVLAGQRSSSAFKGSLYKAQIGEFSFIIASLGIALEVVRPELMSVAVGVSLITIVITPLLASISEPFFNLLNKRTPSGVHLAARIYHDFLASIGRSMERRVIFKLVKRPLIQISFYFLMFNGILVLTFVLAGRIDTTPGLNDIPVLGSWAIWIISGVACLPFIIAILRNINVVVMMLLDTAFSSVGRDRFIRGKLRNAVNGLVLFLVISIFGALYFAAASAYLPKGAALFAFCGILAVTGAVFWQRMVSVNSRLEHAFLESLKEANDTADQKHKEALLKDLNQHSAAQIELGEAAVSEGSIADGSRISEIDIREITGASVVGIGRGNTWVYDPSPEATLFGGDRVFIAGNRSQIARAQQFLLRKRPDGPRNKQRPMISRIFVETGGLFDGATLAALNLRKRLRISVLGVLREDEWMSPPSPEALIHAGDILVVIGSKADLERCEKEQRGEGAALVS